MRNKAGFLLSETHVRDMFLPFLVAMSGMSTSLLVSPLRIGEFSVYLYLVNIACIVALCQQKHAKWMG